MAPNLGTLVVPKSKKLYVLPSNSTFLIVAFKRAFQNIRILFFSSNSVFIPLGRPRYVWKTNEAKRMDTKEGRPVVESEKGREGGVERKREKERWSEKRKI